MLPKTKTFSRPETIREYLFRNKHCTWNGECLEWTAARHDSGYGLVWIDSKIWRVHIAVWTLEVEEPKNDVLHKCNNPPCFLLDHLYDGIESENGLDMVRSGRVRNQWKIPAYDIVLEVRRLYKTGQYSQRTLAKMFNIDQRTVWSYVNEVSRVEA